MMSSYQPMLGGAGTAWWQLELPVVDMLSFRSTCSDQLLRKCSAAVVGPLSFYRDNIERCISDRREELSRRLPQMMAKPDGFQRAVERVRQIVDRRADVQEALQIIFRADFAQELLALQASAVSVLIGRVKRVDENDPLAWRLALNSSELDSIVSNDTESVGVAFLEFHAALAITCGWSREAPPKPDTADAAAIVEPVRQQHATAVVEDGSADNEFDAADSQSPPDGGVCFGTVVDAGVPGDASPEPLPQCDADGNEVPEQGDEVPQTDNDDAALAEEQTSGAAAQKNDNNTYDGPRSDGTSAEATALTHAEVRRPGAHESRTNTPLSTTVRSPHVSTPDQVLSTTRSQRSAVRTPKRPREASPGASGDDSDDSAFDDRALCAVLQRVDAAAAMQAKVNCLNSLRELFSHRLPEAAAGAQQAIGELHFLTVSGSVGSVPTELVRALDVLRAHQRSLEAEVQCVSGISGALRQLGN